MLAKELKIQAIKKQREFIEKQLRNRAEGKDGDTYWRYAGTLFPEVKEYFEEEGFDVKRIPSPKEFFGMPLHSFTIRADLLLTDEELKDAESIDDIPNDIPEDIDEDNDYMGIEELESLLNQ